MITQKQLKNILHYDKETGVFTWLSSVVMRKVKPGSIAGTVNKEGYRQLSIYGKSLYVHRLAFLYMLGYMPEGDVDHIDRNPSNNRWVNLREVSRSCNMRNCGNREDNVTGVKGVCWHKTNGRWVASIRINRRDIHLGSFNDFTEAVSGRLAAEQCAKWEGCDSSSPAYMHMQNYLSKLEKNN